MSFRRMLPFLLLNILVSAVTVLAVLWWWDGRNATETPAADPLAQPTVVAEAPIVVDPSNPYPAPTEAGAVAEEGGDTSAESDAAAADEDIPVHVVAAGDTLGRISDLYGVAVEDIMAANGLTNPNLLSIGQQIVIPVNGVDAEAVDAEVPAEDSAEAVEPTTEADTQPPTPIPTVAAEESGSAEVLIAEVVGVGDLANEAVQIVNSGGSAATLTNWLLADAHGHTYTFGSVTLFGEGAGIVIHSAEGQDTATDLYWGEDSAIWVSGEIVTLRDADGNTVATFTIP